MPKETLIPIQQYPPQSPHRRGPAHGGHYPMHPPPPHQQPPSRQPQQQPPPSSAAAKAAAAAKALHRRALDRAQQKQSQPPPSHSQQPPRHDPRWEQQQQHEEYKNDDRRRSTMAVFRRSTENDDENRYRMEGYTRQAGPPPPGAPPARRQEEYYQEKPEPPPPYPQMYYNMPYNYPYAPPNYPDEEDKSTVTQPPMIHRPRDEYPRYGYYDKYYENQQYPYYPYPPQEKEEKRVKYEEREHGRSTRRIIGSHTPIHVPRAEDTMPYPGGPPVGTSGPPPPSRDNERPGSSQSNSGRGAVFRSQEVSAKERNAHEILLSLSKSFDKRDEDPVRPKSPEEPPRLKQFHKEKGEGFEPQPSPLRPNPTIDPENDIEFAPSFTLFNQSFDMNLENLLGPNASFGLGPMKSLSFGLGNLGSIDYSDPAPIHRASSRVEKEKKENVQVLRASPSNSFGNVLKVASSEKKGIMVLGDNVRVASPSALEKKRNRSAEEDLVLDGNARNLPFRLKDDENKVEANPSKLDVLEPPLKKKKAVKSPSKMDVALFKIIENHQSAFSAFSFLLPGAKSVLALKKCTIVQEEIARRRINSALCAFGGSALPKHTNHKSASQRKYEQMLPDRYYEDDNRLSWEVEEDPPVEVSDEENSTSSRNKLSSCDSSDSYNIMSLQRNMGIMVYPAINAFIAAEPGVITPALSEMNNFVTGKKSPECTPAKGTMPPPVSKPQALPMVSPDCVKFGPDSNLPEVKTNTVNYAGGAWISSNQSQPLSKKDINIPNHLFIDTQELVPEQYRSVSPTKHQSYQYPSLPVPYAQRKRMSNAVFAMSKSIPGLTDECAAVLSEARKKDAWDFAVAELMTQVVVLTHCEEGDWRLDGLSKYLLSLGIAC